MSAQVISFHCIMKNRLGKILSSSFNQDVINQRDSNNDRLPGLIDGLQSVKAGECRKIVLSAEHAYGSYNPALVMKLRRSELEYGEQLEIGSQILRRIAPASESRLFHVTDLDDHFVVLDGNHPLAGQDLVFEIEIVSAREAGHDDFMEDFQQIPGQLLH